MKRRTALSLLFAMLALVYAYIVGIAEKQTTDAEQQQYCANVRDGLWPDFHGSYKAECGGKNPPQFHENLTKK